MLTLNGLPGIYLPSLFGAKNWHEGIDRSGHARSINRQKFEISELLKLLHTPGSHYEQVFNRYSTLLRVRALSKSFDLEVAQRILKLHSSVFALERGTIIALHNVSNQTISVKLPDDILRRDLLSDTIYQRLVTIQPYQTQWLDAEK